MHSLPGGVDVTAKMSDHFSLVDDKIGPQPWMQWRRVASGQAVSVSRSYDVSDGQAKNDQAQAVQVTWTNNSPIAQWVYGMVTKSGTQVTLQCRSRGYLSTRHGYKNDPDGSDVPMVEVSRTGVGADLGKGGLLAVGGAYGIAEHRQNSTTAPFMPQQLGWYPVSPGETIHARVEVWIVSDNWENAMIEGGDGDTEAKFVTGDLEVALYAVPAFADPLPRLTPTIVGGTSNVKSDRELGVGTDVDVPAGVAAGDVLIAIVTNQLGLSNSITPEEDGWTEMHVAGKGLAYLGDVHMKIFMRTATNSEPSTYGFTNHLAAEETAVIIPIRNCDPWDPTNPNWFIASNVMRYQIGEKQICPSINMRGGMLICVSYVSHSNFQSPMEQYVPAGMTLLKEIPGSGCTLCVAYLTSPPQPTKERQFVPHHTPQWFGHTITASILIPGKAQ